VPVIITESIPRNARDAENSRSVRLSYVFLQGPLAFELYPGYGGDLVSIATAAQHMLFRALAQEVAESRASVVELVGHMLIRDRQTQPTSPLSGEAVGAFVSYLLAGAGEELHGQSVHLRSPEQLADVGVDGRPDAGGLTGHDSMSKVERP
jgi:hypothetical protein